MLFETLRPQSLTRCSLRFLRVFCVCFSSAISAFQESKFLRTPGYSTASMVLPRIVAIPQAMRWAMLSWPRPLFLVTGNWFGLFRICIASLQSDIGLPKFHRMYGSCHRQSEAPDTLAYRFRFRTASLVSPADDGALTGRRGLLRLRVLPRLDGSGE